MTARSLAVALGMASAAGPGTAAGQQAVDAARQVTEKISTFLDCRTFECEFDHVRRQIDFVNWVRDPRDAQVHVLGTHRDTGGGGREHVLVFVGLRQFAGRADTLRYLSSGTDTEAEVRDGLVRTLKLGLVRYVAGTAVAQGLAITYQAPIEGAPPAADPWNLWVFTVAAGGNVHAESERRAWSGTGSAQASRTAEDWKLDVRVSGQFSRDETDVPALDTTFVNSQRRFGFEATAVKSMGAHWSVGLRMVGGSSTFINTDLSVEGGPALEYDLYPYAESTRRQLTFLYTAGVAAFAYEEETVFGVTGEVRPAHALETALAIQEPWGSVRTSLKASQFLHDRSKYRIDLSGGVGVRLVRGVSLNVFGGASRVKNQLFLGGAGLSPEDRLLRTRQFETAFLFFGNIGFSYQFGSKLANVVNPRMAGVLQFF